jgi:hypothetical protein
MNEEDISTWLDAFVDGTIDLAKASELLGPPLPVQLPNRRDLAARDPAVKMAEIETGDDGAVLGINVTFKTPVEVHYQDLCKAFGQPERLPRLKESHPHRHRFMVPSKRGKVRFVIGLLQQGSREVEPVVDVIIRR